MRHFCMDQNKIQNLEFEKPNIQVKLQEQLQCVVDLANNERYRYCFSRSVYLFVLVYSYQSQSVLADKDCFVN